MGYSEARGPLAYEKNLKSKFSCQSPFNRGKYILEIENPSSFQ
jgi:hypothetical protein